MAPLDFRLRPMDRARVPAAAAPVRRGQVHPALVLPELLFEPSAVVRPRGPDHGAGDLTREREAVHRGLRRRLLAQTPHVRVHARHRPGEVVLAEIPVPVDAVGARPVERRPLPQTLTGFVLLGERRARVVDDAHLGAPVLRPADLLLLDFVLHPLAGDVVRGLGLEALLLEIP